MPSSYGDACRTASAMAAIFGVDDPWRRSSVGGLAGTLKTLVLAASFRGPVGEMAVAATRTEATRPAAVDAKKLAELFRHYSLTGVTSGRWGGPVQARLVGKDHNLNTVAEFELHLNALDMRPYGGLLDEELRGDLAVRKPAGDLL